VPGAPRPPIRLLQSSPLIRRVVWHLRRVSSTLEPRFFLSLLEGAFAIVLVTALFVTAFEAKAGENAEELLARFGRTVTWGVFTVLGQGDSGYVTQTASFVASWVLVLFGVAIVGTITGALVALVIDFLLKEGQGMGAAGYRDHIVVCGWNSTARDLVQELRGDEYKHKVVLLADVEKNPAGSDVYFVKGDPTEGEDLERAGIRDAAAALIFPRTPTNEADMQSILTCIAIESMAPEVRTVVEVVNPRNVEHLQRANADEILVTSQLASRLLARSALYPGLTGLVADLVSGGEGSELYRVELPSSYVGMTIDDISTRLRREHRATLVAVSRGTRTYTNPDSDFRLLPGDDALVVAESLGTLTPLRRERMQELGQTHAHQHVHEGHHAEA
jgi:voltage-gated potassium channel